MKATAATSSTRRAFASPAASAEAPAGPTFMVGACAVRDALLTPAARPVGGRALGFDAPGRSRCIDRVVGLRAAAVAATSPPRYTSRRVIFAPPFLRLP